MTKGEYMVGINFNPSNSDSVNELIKTFAKMIDMVNQIDDTETMEVTEVKRLKELAITQIETASMFAVKAATKPGRDTPQNDSCRI